MPSPTYPDVVVPLSGHDGNAFAIAGRVSDALRRADHRDAAAVFVQEVFAQPSYDAVLQLVMRTVTVA